MDQKPTILQIKRRREESYHDTIILERPTKIRSKKGSLIDDLQALSLNIPAPSQKVFRFLASTAQEGHHFISNEEKVRELLQKRRESLFQTPSQSTEGRREKQENAAKAARSEQINRIRELSNHNNSPVGRLLELSVIPVVKSQVTLPPVRKMTEIFDENDYVTHYYYLDQDHKGDIPDGENACTYPVESFDFGDNEYDDENPEEKSDSEIDYPSTESEEEMIPSDEEYMTHAYNPQSEEEYGPEDSYSLD